MLISVLASVVLEWWIFVAGQYFGGAWAGCPEFPFGL